MFSYLKLPAEMENSSGSLDGEIRLVSTSRSVLVIPLQHKHKLKQQHSQTLM